MSTASLATALNCLRRPAEERSDTQLLEAYTIANDQAAFAALVKRHGPMVLGVCRRALQDVHDAEDAFQAVFLTLARSASSIRNREALTGWLHGVAYRITLRVKRDAARRRKHEGQVRPRLEAPAWEVGWRELQAVLDEEVERLPPAFRAAFVLCCLEGLSKTEAAERLGTKANTVTSRLARARKRLQQRLARRGISLSAVLAALAVSGAGRAAVGLQLLRSTVSVTVLSARVRSLAEGGTTNMLSMKGKLALVLLSLALGSGLVLFARQALHTPAAAVAQQTPTRPPDDTIEVKGRVLGPDGRPVAGATLYLARRVEFFRGDPLPSPRRCGMSGPDGRFRLRIPCSTWTERAKAVVQLVAVAAGFGPGWVLLDKATNREVAVRLVKDDVPITGRILDLQGRPIRGAVIGVEAIQAAPDESLTSWLQAVRAKKRVRHDEFLSRELIGSPLPGLPATITTDAEGRFRLTGVGRERALVVLIGGRKLAAEAALVLTRRMPRFEVFENLTTDDKLTVYGASFQHVAAPAKPVTGTVRDKDTGKPLAGVRVGLDDPTFQAVTDKAGKFRLDSLPFDLDRFGLPLLAVPPRDLPYLPGFKEVKQGRGLEAVSVDFRLKRGVWVEGKVTDKFTGKPVRTNIEYCPAADNPNRKDRTDFGRWPSLARDIYSTGADGQFRVPVLPGPGTIMAHGLPTDYITSGSFRFNAPTNGKPITCRIILDPGRTLTGTILGPDGKPLSGVYLFNVDPLHFWAQRPLATADFTLTALDPRSRRSALFLYPEKHWVKAVVLQGNATNPVTVRLEPAGVLSGRLVDEDGQPRPGVKLLIHFVRKDDGGIANHFSGQITTDRQGRFRVEDVAPGVMYQINLGGKSNMTIGSVVNRLTVKSGETKDLGDVKGRLFTD